jgi:hypothetical protein
MRWERASEEGPEKEFDHKEKCPSAESMFPIKEQKGLM